MKTLWTDEDQYNIEETSKWGERLEKEVFPLIDDMAKEGYKGCEIREFVAYEISSYMAFRIIANTVKEKK